MRAGAECVRRDKLVVWVLGSHLVEFGNDGDLFLDGVFYLLHQRGIYRRGSLAIWPVYGFRIHGSGPR